MLESGPTQRRINIGYFEGVNSLVSFNLGSHTEFLHAENARSKTIGTIEKREGQVVLGTNTQGKPFVTSVNYSLFPFQNNYNQGLYRISAAENADLSVSVTDTVFTSDLPIPEEVGTPVSHVFPLTIGVIDSLVVSEQVAETPGVATIYYLDNGNHWTPLSGDGADIPAGEFDYTYAEGCVFLVNLNAPNRYITEDGTTVVTANSSGGHLHNTPPSSVINYYKGRLYLADFTQAGVRYKTTVLRSSTAMGIISEIDGDFTGAVSGSEIDVVDTTYFSTDVGSNTYDIYRSLTLITTITVTGINETSIVATWSGTLDFSSGDNIWVAGTYDGPKVFRWVSNPTITGTSVKQYDTFKLSGGENDSITMLTNIGNVMLIANKSTIATWNDYTPESFDLDVGCVSRNGYIKAAGTLYFLHYTGIYSTTGSTPNIISNKIQSYITGATKEGKEKSAAGKKGLNIFFTLGDVTLYKVDGSVNKILKDVC